MVTVLSNGPEYAFILYGRWRFDSAAITIILSESVRLALSARPSDRSRDRHRLTRNGGNKLAAM